MQSQHYQAPEEDSCMPGSCTCLICYCCEEINVYLPMSKLTNITPVYLTPSFSNPVNRPNSFLTMSIFILVPVIQQFFFFSYWDSSYFSQVPYNLLREASLPNFMYNLPTCLSHDALSHSCFFLCTKQDLKSAASIYLVIV